MELAFSDAWTVINDITLYVYNLQVFGSIKLGNLIILVGTLGALITMIVNYKR